MTISAVPGQIFTATLVGAPPGLVGQLGFTVIDLTDGVQKIAHRTTDIVEVSAGMYATSDTAPAVEDVFSVVWDFGGDSATEDLIVSAGTYASPADVRKYAPELTDRPDDELLREIRRAERDIDWYAGFSGAVDEVSGLRFLPLADLPSSQAFALTRATCAQVEYRLYMGKAFTVDEMQYKEVQGKDQTVTGPQRMGPAARSEFPVGLRKLTGRFA